ncbi:MAG: TIGR03790 family protein [Limisphaerales bacterium]
MHSTPGFGMVGTVLLTCALACKLQAGGSGLNTVVIVNQTSSNSCELGNYYCQQRQVPPQNVLYINWSGGNTLWTNNDFQTNLVTPLLNMLTTRQLTNQIDYVVLSMDIPFQTSFGSTVNSTTSALFYGLRLGDGTDPLGTTNSYAASEAAFSPAAPVVGSPGYSFLATMITGGSLTQAEQLVDQGVASDGTFPQQPVVLAKSSDPARNIRYTYFDNAIFNVNILGVSSILRTNTDAVSWPNGCLGYETGLAQFSVPQNTFVPGAVADSLTSFGGIIFGSNSQTNLLAFINAGAAGSYGTVAEPGGDTQKFPNPQVYFYQARGFSLAESYYQSINVPYLGLIVAEPLAAPFAVTGYGEWSTNLPPGSVLSGTPVLSVQFAATYGKALQQVDLFVDGQYFSTLTNLTPCPGNLLTVALNGYPITYTVPTNSSLSTAASGLAALINAATNATQVKALVHGDRIELQSIATNLMTVPFYAVSTAPTNTPGLSYRVNYLPDTFPPEMTPSGLDKSGAFTMAVEIPSTLPYVILASTNLMNWQPIFTNSASPGLLDFTDYDSTNYPARFYRMTWPVPDQPPQLSAPVITGSGTFQMQVDSTPGLPWAVQSSTDLVNWTSVFTNQLGGPTNFVDTGIANSSSRFYRAWLVPPGSPGFTVLNLASNLTLVQVNNAAQPYTIGISTNQGQWTPLGTNFAIGQIQTTAASAIGTGNVLSTFVRASQPAFLASQAFGVQGYSELSNSVPANSWMQFTFTKTNGQTVVVAVTNQSAGNSVTLASQLYNAINATPALQGSDGVVAEDYALDQYGTFFYTVFNLYARSPGYPAAAIQITPTVSALVPSFTTYGGTLTYNLSDLQPRNHLYINAGASSLAVTFPLNTTTLADGYHNLTAVAYEGSDARTETQVTVPVQIQNTSLSATLTLLDLTNQAPVQGTYHIQVAANTNDVSLITLFSTGGALSTATNVSTAIFQVNGTNLWAGLHPFYATVMTVDGLQYRTQTQWVQLGP